MCSSEHANPHIISLFELRLYDLCYFSLFRNVSAKALRKLTKKGEE